MTLWPRVRAALLRLLGAAGAGRRDDEIAEELATHLAMLEDEARRGGVGDREAARQAAARFGSTAAVAEAYRDRRGVPALAHWRRDVAYAVRSLCRAPALALSMVLVLAVGIGAGTAVLMVLHAIAWRSLPVPEADRVVKLSLSLGGDYSRWVMGHPSRFSYPEFERYQGSTQALAAMAAFRPERLIWRAPGEPRPLEGTLVAGRYFEVLQVRPLAGRLLTPADARLPVAVVSERFWRDNLAADPGAVGSTIVLDRRPHALIGVVAAPFAGTEISPSQVWVPLENTMAARGSSDRLAQPDTGWLQVLGRLSPEATIAQASAEAALVAGRIDAPYRGRRTTIAVTRATPLDPGLFGPDDRGQLVGAGLAVVTVIGILLFICGSNVAGLLLARGAARQREIAVRLALGASRGRIVQQLAAEVLVITGAGGALGVLACLGLLRLLALSPDLAPIVGAIGFDWRVLLAAGVTATAIGAIFGLAPARQGFRVECLGALKGQVGVLGSRIPAGRLRSWLIAAQVAVSVLCLAAGAVAARSVQRAAALDPGYATAGLFVIQPDIRTSSDHGQLPHRAQDLEALASAFAAAPGIRSVGRTMIGPFVGTGWSTAARPGQQPVAVQVNAIDDGYLATLGVNVLVGRPFLPNESSVVLVNSALARSFWGSETAAVGQLLSLPLADGTSRTVDVVGVLPPLQTTWPGVPDDPMYLEPMPAAARDDAPMFVVRADAGTPVARLATTTARMVDPDAFVQAWSVDEQIASRAAAARAASLLAWTAGLLALLVGAVGLHGIVAHTVVCRTRDIGVHIALGASRREVLTFVLRQTLTGAVAGATAGLGLTAVAGLSLASVARKTLFGLHPLDPIAVAAAMAVLAAVTMVAAWLPARRALGVSPIQALKQD